MSKQLTKRELIAFEGVSDDFPFESDNYYAMRAIETYGAAIRDNTLMQLIDLGREVDQETDDD